MTRLTLVVALVLGACSGPEQRVDGVVVSVDGGLDGVTGFEVVTAAGDRLEFVPGAGMTRFDDGAPLSHLHEHLQTGAAVRVTYRDEAGTLVAVAVGDAP